ncbi:MAG TPA: ABC transporter permease [Candidatus Angelobacter sp.]
MNTQVNGASESLASAAIAPPAIPVTRLIYWSLRRELWENRSIYIAPLAAAVVFLFGFIISVARSRYLHSLEAAHPHHGLTTPHEFAAGLIMGTAFIVGIFYSLDALYGERRDRSILLWKSLPVSDVITVLSKLTIPILVLPLLSFVITIATQFIMLLLSTVLLLGSGQDLAALWTQSSFFHVSLMLLYHLLLVHGLWYAPMYGWLLLVSAWAPRAPFIWAFLPPFVVVVVEKMAFNTTYFLDVLKYRVTGPEGPGSMTGNTPMDPLASLIPVKFFSVPGLWIGLAVAAAFLAVTVRLRRSRGPI